MTHAFIHKSFNIVTARQVSGVRRSAVYFFVTTKVYYVGFEALYSDDWEADLETKNVLYNQEFTVTCTRELIFFFPKHLDMFLGPLSFLSNEQHELFLWR
jgi:hypothetical protein